MSNLFVFIISPIRSAERYVFHKRVPAAAANIKDISISMVKRPGVVAKGNSHLGEFGGICHPGKYSNLHVMTAYKLGLNE